MKENILSFFEYSVWLISVIVDVQNVTYLCQFGNECELPIV